MSQEQQNTNNIDISEFVDIDDVIRRKSNPQSLGTIIEVPWEDASGDDEPLKENEFRVLFESPCSSTVVVPFDDIEVLDRTFQPGTIVCAKGNYEKSGEILQAKCFLDIRFPSGKAVKNVPSTLLKTYLPCEERNPVLLKSENALGQVVGTDQMLKLLFHYKTGPEEQTFVCYIPADTEGLISELENDSNIFYPGQTLSLTPNAMTQLVTDFTLDPRKRRLVPKKIRDKLVHSAIVTDVQLIGVEVDWMYYENDEPEESVRIDGIEVLNFPIWYTKHLLGERVTFKDPARIDEFIDEEKSTTLKKTKAKKNRKRRKKQLFIETQLPQVGLISFITTFYKIRWQNGEIEDNVRSVDLSNYDTLQLIEFWPQTFVVKKTENEEVGENSFGYIEKVLAKDRIVLVRWLTDDNGNRLPSDEIQEESLSYYDITHHSTFNEICPDNLILDVVSEENPDAPFLSRFGYVTSILNGDVNVTLLNGTATTLPIESVLCLDNEDEDDDEEEDEEGDEYEDEENENENENEADENVEARRESFNGSSMHSIMQAVDDLNAEKVSDLLPSDGEEESDEEEKEEEKPVENQAVQGNAENNEYFATVPECPGFHQYVAEEYRPTPFLTRRIMKEWNELKTNLSGGIYVRAFESNINLLQVLIFGPHNTPYHDSVFIFDVNIHSSYPQNPPDVYYHSVIGQKFNPNLNADGTICLSLLGTWHGEGVETWNSSSSNILQLLLSIQGLVLGTEEPYYLEANFDKRKGSTFGAFASLRYNPSAIVASHQHALRFWTIAESYDGSLENSSYHPDFLDLIKKHFESCAPKILERLKRYVDFVKANPDASKEQLYPFFGIPLLNSEGFVLELEKLIPKFQEKLDKVSSSNKTE